MLDSDSDHCTRILMLDSDSDHRTRIWMLDSDSDHHTHIWVLDSDSDIVHAFESWIQIQIIIHAFECWIQIQITVHAFECWIQTQLTRIPPVNTVPQGSQIESLWEHNYGRQGLRVSWGTLCWVSVQNNEHKAKTNAVIWPTWKNNFLELCCTC